MIFLVYGVVFTHFGMELNIHIHLSACTLCLTMDLHGLWINNDLSLYFLSIVTPFWDMGLAIFMIALNVWSCSYTFLEWSETSTFIEVHAHLFLSKFSIGKLWLLK